MRQTDPDNYGSADSNDTSVSRSSLVDRAPFGICRSSLSRDRFTSVNPAFCRMLGYSEEELLAMRLSERLYSDTPNRFELLESAGARPPAQCAGNFVSAERRQHGPSPGDGLPRA